MGYESLLQYIKWKELVGQEQAIAKLKEYDFYISAEEQIRREGELAICFKYLHGIIYNFAPISAFVPEPLS